MHMGHTYTHTHIHTLSHTHTLSHIHTHTRILFISKREKKLCHLTNDSSREFNCNFINVNLMAIILNEFSVNEHTCRWLMLYLNERSRCTKYFGLLKDALPITSSVPKGSIIGPVLFNIYLNRLLTLLLKKMQFQCRQSHFCL